MAIFFACGVGFTKVRPTQRKLRSRHVIFQFPMLFVRDCSLSAAANGFSSPKTHRRRRSIRGTRSSVTFVLRFARTESKLVAGTISGTQGTTLRKHGWSAKVRADILGHSSLQVTDGVYDHADQDDFREALAGIASELLRDVTKPQIAN